MPDTYAGATITPTITDAPQDLEGVIELGFLLLPAETIIVAATADGITEYPQDDGTSNYQGSIEIPDDAEDGSYQAFWLDDEVVVGVEDYTVGDVPSTAFATAADIAGRLGRDLTDAETTQVATLLPLATGRIAAAVGQDAAWAADLSPIPDAIRGVTIEMTVRVLLNPAGAQSFSETLGQHQYSANFGDGAAVGLMLSSDERRQVRRAVRGSSFASVTLETPYSGDVEDEQPDLPL